LETNWENPLNVTYEYPIHESVICIGHEHSSYFGHSFLEILPRNITSSSIVVVPEKHHVVGGFEFLGIKDCQIVASINTPIFARDFYTAEDLSCGDLTRFLIGSMRNLPCARSCAACFPSPAPCPGGP
jgi:hypothetical protein